MSSNIIALFIAEFDVRSGYKLVHQEAKIAGFDFDGLEYKVLPSGIQEFGTSTVLFSHWFQGKVYYGLSKYYQYIIGDDSRDRNNVKMFAMGVLCEPKPSVWKPNEFIDNGWEYADAIHQKLVSFVHLGEYVGLKGIPKVVPNVDNHLLTNLPEMFRSLGPLVFVLYKQSLLRKRILIFNQHHKSYDDQDILPSGVDNLYNISSFCYLISLLSVVPQEIDFVETPTYSQPVYQIGLTDMGGELLKCRGYIGSTNDDILKDNPVYDIGVIIDEHAKVFDYAQQPLRATNKDYQKFGLIYLELPRTRDGFTNSSGISADDLSSIRSDVSKDFSGSVVGDTPSWWKTDATEPVSWTESIWSAFSWFATAGQYGDVPPPPRVPDKVDLVDLVNIVGYFHKLTKKWFYMINEAVLEVWDDQASTDDQPLTRRICLELTYQDVVEMELDPYSNADLEFLKQFVLLYWEVVDSVEIGMGLNSICC